MKKLFNKIIDKPILSAVLILFLSLIVVILLTGFFYDIQYFLSSLFPESVGLYNPDFFANILVEAHGMLFDVIVFGIILVLLEVRRTKRQTIKRHLDEINDFRGWKSPEAAHRIRGSIMRLNRLGVEKIDLRHCFLKEMDLLDVKLKGSTLWGVNLEKGVLESADLQGTDMMGAKLEGCELYWAKLEGAVLKDVDLRNCKMLNVDLRDANLDGAKLDGADLWQAHLEGANLETANLQNTKLVNAFYNKETKFPAWLDQNRRGEYEMIQTD